MELPMMAKLVKIEELFVSKEKKMLNELLMTLTDENSMDEMLH